MEMPVKPGTASLPLHWGRTTPCLFERMAMLAKEFVLVMLCDDGSSEIIRRMSDPFWFQALGCALGFDWHSSGLTTTVCGALKEAAALLARQHPERLIAEIKTVSHLDLPARHNILKADIEFKKLYTILAKTYEQQPADFTTLLGRPGVGLKTLRALALLSELLYGAPVSYRDPARFSYAHGGKDAHPYPVDRATYDQSIDILRQIVDKARADASVKKAAFRQLSCFSFQAACQSHACHQDTSDCLS